MSPRKRDVDVVIEKCVDLSSVERAEKDEERRNRHADLINFVEKDEKVY